MGRPEEQNKTSIAALDGRVEIVEERKVVQPILRFQYQHVVVYLIVQKRAIATMLISYNPINGHLQKPEADLQGFDRAAKAVETSQELHPKQHQRRSGSIFDRILPSGHFNRRDVHYLHP